MIALDTNVLVRFLIVDDETPEHTELARRLMAGAFQREEQVYVSLVCVVETVWVLSSSLRAPKEVVIPLLQALCSTPGVVVQEAGAVERALAMWEQGPAGFSDYLVRELSLSAGARVLVSFDKRLGRAPHVMPPSDPTLA